MPNGRFTALMQHVFYHPPVSECTHLKPLLDSKLPVEPVLMQTTAHAKTFEQPITLTRLVPMVRMLPVPDKLRLIRILAEEIENAAGISAFDADETSYAQRWDKQIEEDLEAGRLDALLADVDKEYAAGLGQPL